MSYLNRPRRRLVSHVPSNALALEDMRWVTSQGFDYKDLPRLATWYYPRGGSGLGHTDPYHLHLYRLKGFTLKAPYIPPPPPKKIPAHPLVRKAIQVLGDETQWVGTASDFITASGIWDKTPDKLGRAIFKAKVTESMDREGINISRKYLGKARVLVLQKVA